MRRRASCPLADGMRCGVGGSSFNERFVVRMITAEFLRSLAADVAAGRPVELSFDDFPCFTAEALEGRAHVTPAALAEISAGLDRKSVV